MSEPVIQTAQGISTATAHEAAGRVGALPSRIKPVRPDMRLCGRAFPVRSPAGDNLFLHHAIYAAQSGDILIVDCGEGDQFGYWGEVMSVAAQAVGLGGLVISGGIRDAERLGELGFPVFSGWICIRGTGKDPHGEGSLGEAIQIEGIEIQRGDIVLGDRDGVMIIAQDRAEAVIARARARDAEEQSIFERLKAGETTMQIYGLPAIAMRR